jgi:hypothetical protein
MEPLLPANSWGQGVAKAIAFVFHPLFIPTYSIILLLQTDGVMDTLYNQDLKLQLIGIVFVGTLLLPVVAILVLKWRKTITSYHLHDRKERLAPLSATLVFFFMTYRSFSNSGIDPTIALLSLNSVYIALAIIAVTIYWKISIHAAAMGGMTSSFLLISNSLSTNPLFLAVGLLALSGAVCYARIKTDAHQPAQVYAGYLMGMAISLLTFFVF